MWPILLLACWTTERRADEAQELTAMEMEDHWSESSAVRDALIAGDLDLARAKARALRGRLPIRALPAELGAMQDQLEKDCRALEAAEDIETAAEALGMMGITCGACHAAVDARPLPDAPTSPDGDATTREHMVRHRWSADRMWAGLVNHDEVLFAQAVEVLQQATLAPSGTTVDAMVPAGAVELEVQVHDLAAQAARADRPASRAHAFGQMVATCAACHSLLRAGPPAENSDAVPAAP